MDDLIAFLCAQLDEDERIARAATQGPWLVDCETHAEAIIAGDGTSVIAGGRWGDEASAFESTEDALHIAAHDPARVLREVEAKREVVRLAERAHDYHETFLNGFAAAMEQALRLFALAYADRPGYREEWRP